MSLPLSEKIAWKIKNNLEVFLVKSKQQHQPTGCLSHRHDPRDIIFGIGEREVEPPKHAVWSVANDVWRFNQNPFNICVFASAVIGASHQEGKRFSVKFTVQLAKKLGMITGNGYSYLRAAREIAVKYGRLPYEMMPDEINGQSWPEYSRYEITDEMLKEAAKWKAPSYKKITNAKSAIAALGSIHVLFTANDWFSGMNYPQPDDYYLQRTGKKIGGHAWFASGYRSTGQNALDWENVQSFGEYYANIGKARIKSLFSTGNFDIYIEEKIEGRSDLERLLGIYEGKCISGYNDPAIYKVENGQKRGFLNWEAYMVAGKPKFYEIPMDFINQIPTGEIIS